MKKIIMTLMAACLAAPVMADPIGKDDYYTNHSMGCMLLRECTEDVKQVFNINDIANYHSSSDYSVIVDEFHGMLAALDQVGVNVFLADEKYFPVGYRGVYHTVGNNFFLNKTFMKRPHVLMSVMRHEGWHAAQDCMAGTIENNMIAIIHNEDDVPEIWQEIASKTYESQPGAIPWEKEAFWAGKTEGMTQAALESCARGSMWSDYEPTPKTREWLEENNFISK
jgi:hypothetical protein